MRVPIRVKPKKYEDNTFLNVIGLKIEPAETENRTSATNSKGPGPAKKLCKVKEWGWFSNMMPHFADAKQAYLLQE